jgi:hypothetical protein
MMFVATAVKRDIGPCECRKKKRDEEAQAHMAHGEEEEQSLLLAFTIVHNA